MEKKKNNVQVFPSILSADFGKLAEEAKKLEGMGVEGIHVDIMDGHFVPNLTLGPKAVAALNRATDLFLDVHLMMYNPFDYIERFVEAGADRLTFHLEATEEVFDTLNYIHKCGVQAGLAFCPETSKELIPKYLEVADLILIMTVHPGFGGQSFMPEVIEKISFTQKACEVRKLSKDIQVDGGINNKTAPLCIEAGATCLVSGNYLYQAEDMKQAIRELRS